MKTVISTPISTIIKNGADFSDMLLDKYKNQKTFNLRGFKFTLEELCTVNSWFKRGCDFKMTQNCNRLVALILD